MSEIVLGARNLTKRFGGLAAVDGVSIADAPGPIISITPGSRRQAGDLQRRLLRAGILPPLIRYPSGSNDAYFRFALCSEHTPEQLDSLAHALASWHNK